MNKFIGPWEKKVSCFIWYFEYPVLMHNKKSTTNSVMICVLVILLPENQHWIITWQHQAISWSSVEPHLWHYMVSLGHKEFRHLPVRLKTASMESCSTSYNEKAIIEGIKSAFPKSTHTRSYEIYFAPFFCHVCCKHNVTFINTGSFEVCLNGQ